MFYEKVKDQIENQT